MTFDEILQSLEEMDSSDLLEISINAAVVFNSRPGITKIHVGVMESKF